MSDPTAAKYVLCVQIRSAASGDGERSKAIGEQEDFVSVDDAPKKAQEMTAEALAPGKHPPKVLLMVRIRPRGGAIKGLRLRQMCGADDAPKIAARMAKSVADQIANEPPPVDLVAVASSSMEAGSKAVAGLQTIAQWAAPAAAVAASSAGGGPAAVAAASGDGFAGIIKGLMSAAPQIVAQITKDPNTVKQLAALGESLAGAIPTP